MPQTDQLTRNRADDRFDTLVAMTPSRWAPLGPDATASIEAPTFLMTAGRDMTLPDAEHGDPLWDDFQGSQHLRASFPEAGHFTFSNSCEIGVGFGDGCGPGFIEIEAAHELINTLVLSWLRSQRTGDPDALTELERERAEAVLSRK